MASMITFMALIILPLAFLHGFLAETAGQPRRGGGIEVPPDRVRSEFIQVQKSCPVADLLVRGKADADPAVGDLFPDQGLAHGHDLGNAGLVVGPQDRSPVGGQDGLSPAFLKMRENVRIQDPAGLSQRNGRPVIALDHLGMGIRSSAVIHWIQMRNKTDGPAMLIPGRGRKKAVDIGVLVHENVLQAHFLHFLFQEISQVELTLSSRRSLSFSEAGGIDRCII